MIINYPKFSLTFKSMIYIGFILLITSIFTVFTKLLWWQGLIISLVLVVTYIVVGVRKKRIFFYKYLSQFGVQSNAEDFLKKKFVVGLVPFGESQIACSSYVDENFIYLGKGTHIRKIPLETIKSIDIVEWAGNPVAVTEVVVANETVAPIFIPWDVSFNYILERVDTLYNIKHHPA